MFAGELHKQKLLFAAGDCLALMTAFVVAVMLHDPARSTEQRLVSVDPLLVALSLSAVLTVFGVALLIANLKLKRSVAICALGTLISSIPAAIFTVSEFMGRS